MLLYLAITGALSLIVGLSGIAILDMVDVTEISLLPWHLAENSEKLNWLGVTVVTLIHIAAVPFLFALQFVIWVVYRFRWLCIKKEYRK